MTPKWVFKDESYLEDRWEDEHHKLYIGADVDAS